MCICPLLPKLFEAAAQNFLYMYIYQLSVVDFKFYIRQHYFCIYLNYKNIVILLYIYLYNFFIFLAFHC